MTESSVYEPPEGLVDVAAEATCQADVSILVQEPQVTGTSNNSPSGSRWTGVKEIKVTLVGAERYTATTSASGTATIAGVPCGTYRVLLEQREFSVENLSEASITVAGGKKSGTEFEFEVRRKLLTVEMFRLPTLYIDGVKAGLGKAVDVDQDPYGHHWIKIYKDEASARLERPMESYGWWPIEGASADRLWNGVKGSLNGYDVHSPFPNRDPYHTAYLRGDKKLEDVFFPYVTNGFTADEYKAKIRASAKAYDAVSGGIWSWRGNGAGYHCKTFQAYLMREVYLWKRLGVGVWNLGWSANV
jgi:hypothetical protein